MAESFRIIPKKALEDVTTYKITHVHDYDIMVHPVSILKLYPIYSNITFPYHMTSGHLLQAQKYVVMASTPVLFQHGVAMAVDSVQ